MIWCTEHGRCMHSYLNIIILLPAWKNYSAPWHSTYLHIPFSKMCVWYIPVYTCSYSSIQVYTSIYRYIPNDLFSYHDIPWYTTVRDSRWRHSPAPTGVTVRRGTSDSQGCTGLKAVETHGRPGRAGQQPKMWRYRKVAVRSRSICPLRLHTVSQLPFIRESGMWTLANMMRFPTHATMNY